MNYRVEVRIVNAADHGEATTRRMIGNAWSVRTAEALCRVILEQVAPKRAGKARERVA